MKESHIFLRFGENEECNVSNNITVGLCDEAIQRILNLKGTIIRGELRGSFTNLNKYKKQVPIETENPPKTLNNPMVQWFI